MITISGRIRPKKNKKTMYVIAFVVCDSQLTEQLK